MSTRSSASRQVAAGRQHALPFVVCAENVVTGCYICYTVAGLIADQLSDSVATRIGYALILMVNSILAWIMLTPWAINKLQHLTLDYMKISCGTGECYGWVAVLRINFALGMFHVLLGILLLGVDSTKNPRAAIQNGFWGPKIIGWLALIVLSFLIPESFYQVWSYIAFFGAMLFVLLGLILLVDLAHTWAEYCVSQIEEYDSRAWRAILVGSTLGMYAVSIAMTIVQYIFFAAGGCSMNQAAITINLIFVILVSFLSVHPAIQDFNPKAGLAQSAMVSIYCTYLTMSAVSMEPDDKHCNPLYRGRGTRTTSIVIGALFTMLALAYTTTRAATQGVALGGSGKSVRLGEDEHDLITQQPDSRREMRAAALRQAVAEGSLPADALLDDDSDDEDDSGTNGKDDERKATQYSYSLFHLIFFLATCWVATLLTAPLDPKSPESSEKDGFMAVGRTYSATWVKIVSSWVCYAIYSWSLVAPMVLPDREFS